MKLKKISLNDCDKKTGLGFSWIPPEQFFFQKAPGIEEAIFAFKRSIPVYAARTLNTFERVGASDEKAKVIIEYGRGVDMPTAHIRTIENYGNACNFLFDRLRDRTWRLEKEFICVLHTLAARDEVRNPGKFRGIPIYIENSVYTPPPAERLEQIYDAGMELLSRADVSVPECALAAFFFLSRTQFFENGNKRTAALVMNAILLDNGYMPLSIDRPPLELLRGMADFYETADATRMMAEFNEMAGEQYPTNRGHEKFPKGYSQST
jgi:hypothetical protein